MEHQEEALDYNLSTYPVEEVKYTTYWRNRIVPPTKKHGTRCIVLGKIDDGSLHQVTFFMSPSGIPFWYIEFDLMYQEISSRVLEWRSLPDKSKDSQIYNQYLGVLGFLCENAVHYSNTIEGNEAREMMEEEILPNAQQLTGIPWKRTLNRFDLDTFGKG